MYRRAQRLLPRQDPAPRGTSLFAPRPFAQVQRRVVPPLVATTIQRAILPHETVGLERNYASQVRVWLVQKFEDELAQRGGREKVEGNSVISWIPDFVLDEITRVLRGATPFDRLPQLEQQKEIEKLRLIINDHLDQIDLALERVPRSTMPKVQIGNEFTFTNAALIDAVKGKDKKERARDMPTPFIAARDSWRKAMSALGYEGKLFEYAKGTPHAVHYEFKVNKDTWGYDVTMDDGVVEVVTTPVPAEALHTGEIAHMIDAYIFGVATSIGLAAHRDYGSGHINVDLGTAFRGDALTLRNFIVAFFNDRDFWKGEDPDHYNAPFPDEFAKAETIKVPFEKVIERFDSSLKSDNPWSVQKLGEELREKVFTENLVGEGKGKSAHYQAINLEHMNEKDVEERRIEVRRVPAQQHRRQLMEQLDRIGWLLDQAKQGEPLGLKM